MGHYGKNCSEDHKKSAECRMKYLRLLYVSFLLSIVITGCHKTRRPVLPPPQAQIPIISTMPPLPQPTLAPVQLGKPAPPPVVVAAPPPPPVKKRVRVHHRRPASKPAGEAATPSSGNATTAVAAEGGPASPIGQLSAEDTNVNPKQAEQTKRLIDAVQKRVNRLSGPQVAAHKADVAAINAFLTQAKQAWNSNDLVGAETLAKKAKILLDELLK